MLRALEPPRHNCHACGACCHGVRVRLLCDEERVRVTALGARLGVASPITADGHLRIEGGQCVFLGEDRLCNLHRNFGAGAKPHSCRQYPAVLVDTEHDTRIGVDPGCFSAWSTWRDGDLLPANAPLAPHAVVRDPDQAAFERAFLTASLRQDSSIARLLHELAGTTVSPALPEGLAGRWVSRLQSCKLGPTLERAAAGAPVQERLGPVVDAVETWDPKRPPPWPVLDEEQERFALEVVRRMLFLRLASTMPAVQGVAMLGLLGAVACAWTTPDAQDFSLAMSAWSRALRAPPFWSALLPDESALHWLAQG